MKFFSDWARAHPQAAYDLANMYNPTSDPQTVGKSESWAQSNFRLDAAARGAVYWRNNVGATPAVQACHCPRCHFDFELKAAPVRYGVCNESPGLNERFKSSDLLGIEPELITQQHVGLTLGLFSAVEMKKPGWTFNPNDDHQAAQAAFGGIVQSKGGLFKFSTGGQ